MHRAPGVIDHDPDRRQVVVCGGGVGALEAILALRALAGDRVEIELVAPEPTFTYRALAVGEPFGLAATPRFDLAAIAEAAGVRLRRDAVARIDPHARRLVTAAHAVVPYDDAVLALGARPVESVRGALTFAGPDDAARLGAALRRVAARAGARVAFLVPPAAAWTLPLYELALLTADWARREGLALELEVVTREGHPLSVFGREGSEEVERLLRARGIALRPASVPEEFEGDHVYLELEGPLRADLAVALPELRGPAIPGLPHDPDGFVPVDAFGRVADAPGVYAVGDMTTRPLKQGGLTAQQADAAASAIAQAAGAEVEAEPYRPVLRGLLLTGEEPRYLRRAAGEPAEPASTEPPWWPAHKIAGRHLAPFLAARGAELRRAS